MNDKTAVIYENVELPPDFVRYGTAQEDLLDAAKRLALYRLKKRLELCRRSGWFRNAEFEMILLQYDPTKEFGMGVNGDMGAHIYRWRVEVPVDLAEWPNDGSEQQPRERA